MKKKNVEIEALRSIRDLKYAELITEVGKMRRHGDHCLHYYGQPDIQAERHRISVNLGHHVVPREGFKLKFRTVLADGFPAVAVYLVDIQIEAEARRRNRGKGKNAQ